MRPHVAGAAPRALSHQHPSSLHPAPPASPPPPTHTHTTPPHSTLQYMFLMTSEAMWEHASICLGWGGVGWAVGGGRGVGGWEWGRALRGSEASEDLRRGTRARARSSAAPHGPPTYPPLSDPVKQVPRSIGELRGVRAHGHVVHGAHGPSW